MSIYFNIYYRYIYDPQGYTEESYEQNVPITIEGELVRREGSDQAVMVVKEGDTLSKILSTAGLSPQDVSAIADAIEHHHPAKQTSIGQRIAISYKPNKEGDIQQGYYSLADTVTLLTEKAKIEVKYDEEKKAYKAEKILMPMVTVKEYYHGEISESLYSDAIKAGASPNMVAEFIQKYSYSVDFQRDIKRGDKFEIYYEATRNDSGKNIAEGPLIYAKLITNNKARSLYRHELSNGVIDYFNENGESTRTTLLLTPINGAKISSKFGNRRHPILGYTKKHEGLDYAAPKGTPILSSGDGVVEEVKFITSGYGKHIKIRHTAKYQTLYAHLDRFAKDLTKGTRVSQGDVIGYVGTTGLSTAPHLHYEVIESGKKINPAKVSFPKMPPLQGSELKRFKQSTLAVVEAINQRKQA